MSACVAILKTGNNKGKLCGKNVKEDTQYCGRHIGLLKTINAVALESKAESLVEEIEEMKISEPKKPKTKKTIKVFDYDDLSAVTQLLIETKNDTNYQIVKLIGKGAFGYVYLVNCLKNDINYALKLTCVQDNVSIRDKNLLYWENNLLTLHLMDCANVIKTAPIRPFINNDRFSYIILNYCEETLEDRITNSAKRMSSTRIKQYGIGLIKTLKEIHRRKYIYIDIKPENIMFESSDSREPILIDFGLTSLWKNVVGDHVQQIPLNTDIGTPMFSSIFANSKQTPDRYGDLQSIGYLLLYMYNGKVPWHDINRSSKILEAKKNIFDYDEFNKAPDYIKQFIKQTYNKQFGENPDYRNLLKILNDE